MHASCTVVHAYGAHSLCVTAPRPRYKNTLMKEPSAREIKPLVYVTNSPPQMRCVGITDTDSARLESCAWSVPGLRARIKDNVCT